MSTLLWRVIYAILCVVLFYWIAPLFADVVGFPLGGSTWTLIKACVAGLAVLYVVFGPPPRTPW